MGKVIFVAGTISQPRIIKRIKSFMDAGLEVEFYAYERGIYNVNIETLRDVDYHIVGKQNEGAGYLKKILQFFKLLRQLKKKYNSESDIFYLFGFFETLSALFLSINYIYEISDIAYGYKKYEKIQWIFKVIDKKMINKSFLTVMTSAGFSDYFFGKSSKNNIIIQPNKISNYFLPKGRNNISFQCNEDKIVFSFIGAFRYPNTIFRFAHVVGKYFPQHQFKFFGDSIMTNVVKEIAAQYDNVEYYGEYKNPDDLESIYEQVDFVVASYDPNGLNERIAEPNKMYEAIYFKKPIVVSSNTFLENQVKKIGCGYAIDASKDSNIIDFINSIKNIDLERIKNNIESVDAIDLIDNGTIEVIEKLNAFVNLKPLAK